MSLFLSAFVLTAALGGGGDAAAEATLKPAFSGTIVSTYPDGRTGRLWLSADGSYTAAGRKGDKSRGRWKIKGGKVCLSQSKPIPAPFAFCTPVPQAQEWSAKAVSGEPIRVRVTPGGRPS